MADRRIRRCLDCRPAPHLDIRQCPRRCPPLKDCLQTSCRQLQGRHRSQAHQPDPRRRRHPLEYFLRRVLRVNCSDLLPKNHPTDRLRHCRDRACDWCCETRRPCGPRRQLPGGVRTRNPQRLPDTCRRERITFRAGTRCPNSGGAIGLLDHEGATRELDINRYWAQPDLVTSCAEQA